MSIEDASRCVEGSIELYIELYIEDVEARAQDGVVVEARVILEDGPLEGDVDGNRHLQVRRRRRHGVREQRRRAVVRVQVLRARDAEAVKHCQL